MTTLALFFRTALAGLRLSPFVHAVAVLTLAVALAAVSLARSVGALVGSTLSDLGGGVQVTLYLDEKAAPEAVEQLRAALATESGGEARLVAADEALAHLRVELGTSGEVLAGLPRNPLPRSLEVKLAQGTSDAAAIRTLATRWSALPGVTAVDYGSEWVDRLAELDRTFRKAGTWGLVLVLLAATVVVASTLQLALHHRRDEIEIQKLVGATDLFIRTPYVLEGLFQGLMGGLLALALLFALELLVGPQLVEAAGALLGRAPEFALVTPERSGEVLLAGVVLGGMGSLVAVGRFLRV